MLSIVAIIVSIYPVPTVLMARLVFKERITPARGIGLGLSLAGLALISLNQEWCGNEALWIFAVI